MNKVNIGFLGVGGIARTHLAAIAMNPSARISGVFDIDLANAQSIAEQYNTHAFKSFEQLLNSGIDALYVCIPPFAHEGQIELAASKGIHIFAEKPIALSMDRGVSIVKAIRKYGVINQIGYMGRYGAAVTAFKDKLVTGIAGNPTLFDGSYLCNSLHSSWWSQKDKSGGQILEQIIHTYDSCMYFLGEPQIACAFMDNLCHKDVDNYTIEDTSASIIKFKSGSIATVSASNCAVPGEWVSSFKVICDNMVADFSDPNHAHFVYKKEKNAHGEFLKESISSDANLIALEDIAFIDAVMKQKEADVPIFEGLKTLSLVKAVDASAQNNGKLIQYVVPDID